MAEIYRTNRSWMIDSVSKRGTFCEISPYNFKISPTILVIRSNSRKKGGRGILASVAVLVKF